LAPLFKLKHFEKAKLAKYLYSTVKYIAFIYESKVTISKPISTTKWFDYISLGFLLRGAFLGMCHLSSAY